MSRSRRRTLLTVAAGVFVASLVASGCGAGSRVGAQAGTKVPCDFAKPSKPVTVNVLAYNSSAIDPFTNAMVASCSRRGVNVEHQPISFGGQVSKTTATLAGSRGTYDIVETYGFVIPQLGAAGKLQPLNPFMKKYGAKYKLSQLNKNMITAMSYYGKLYALPMQAQVFILVYRKDILDKLGLHPPANFEQLRRVARKIQDAGVLKHPLALPLLASADIVTAYGAALGSLGLSLVNPTTKTANFDTPRAKQAFQELMSLKPFMGQDVTTFDQPAVQQQLYNGQAAMAIMFSGRMSDLVQKSNNQYYDKFAFAAPPTVAHGPYDYNALSVDGLSIPKNAQVEPDLLFNVMASTVSEKAAKAAVPAAYPARNGVVTTANTPYAQAANTAIKHAPPPQPYPWTAQVSNDITPIVASVFLGQTSVQQGTQQMQAVATKDLAAYK